MACFSIHCRASGDRLATIEAESWDAAIERFVSSDAGQGHQAADVCAEWVKDEGEGEPGAQEEERMGRMLAEVVDPILCVMGSAAGGRLPAEALVPVVRGAVLRVVMEGYPGEHIGSFVLEDGDGRGQGGGFLYGLDTLAAVKRRLWQLCCSAENVAGRPGDFLRGEAHVAPGDREQLGGMRRILDGLIAA